MELREDLGGQVESDHSVGCGGVDVKTCSRMISTSSFTCALC